MSDKKIPNPGSTEAIDMGRTCAVMDNNHGAGFPYGPEQETCFCITADCPVHGEKSGYMGDEI